VDELDLKMGFRNVFVPCFSLWLTASSGGVWGTERVWILCLFLHAATSFWSGRSYLLFTPSFSPLSSQIISNFNWLEYYDNRIYKHFIFLCKNVFSLIHICIYITYWQKIHNETCFWNIDIMCMCQVLFYIMCILYIYHIFMQIL
jgi:hypothetical protein